MTDKTKVKSKVAIERGYEMIPENYPADKRTPEDMLAIDLAVVNEDPFMFIDSENATWNITGEVVQ